jgi:DNA-binding MarR family transcriptional regulator
MQIASRLSLYVKTLINCLSSNIFMEEEPKDVMVLSAISEGKDEEKKIVKSTRLTPFEVVSVIERLILAGLIEREEKKGFLGKKTKLKVTEKGRRELHERKFELEQKWQKMVMIAKQGDKQQLEQMMTMNRSWIPAMIFMGIIDMMFWMTMLSMIGWSMNQAMPEGYEAPSDQGGDMGGDAGDGGDAGGDFGDFGDISI